MVNCNIQGKMMKINIRTSSIEIVVGNIVTDDTQAIVNPAQKSLYPGCGVDGQIHLWGGEQIQRECGELNGCETGDAKITTGGELQAPFVIHTVGPIWSGGNAGEPELLASCYRRCLEVAFENGIESIAFPAISTGDYGYPVEQAAPIALKAVIQYLKVHDKPHFVRFVLKGRKAFELHCSALDDLMSVNE